MRKLIATATISLVALTGSLAAGSPALAAKKSDEPHSRLAKAVKLKAIRQHQANLQTIADFNGGTRVIGSDGYEISVKYVIDQLERAGYEPERQEFTVDTFVQRGPSSLSQTAPTPETFTEHEDFDTMTFSGSGEVSSAPAVAVDTDSASSGCEPEDFADFTAGAVALIKRGTCTFEAKAANAQDAGAAAVVIYNDGATPDRTGLISGTLGRPFTLPVLEATFDLGNTLVGRVDQGLRLSLETDTAVEQRTAYNVIAETKRGRADNVVVVGGHLDSVEAGPGINDNGSGSATILEAAKQIHKLPKVNNKVRFIFFGAEEEGLLGSAHYVDSLSQAERDKIALMLDFDMLGSPNFVRFVYDGDDSLGIGSNPPPGSGAIEKTFNDYFAGRNLPTEPTAFDGRSDYGPFIAVGIPAGGLFTGAEGIKTPEEVEVYGGTAGEQYDPCYHQACDTFDNVSLTGLDQMADGVAATVETFAESTLPVNGVSLRAQNRAAHAQPLPRMGPYWVR